MCLIIDSCCVPSVFNPNSKEHAQFVPVLNWVTTGNGKIIYGGTKYNTELLHLDRYFKIIIELKKQGRVIQVPSEPIDHYAKGLKLRIPDAAFNDPHIVALVALSRCRIVCTYDKELHPYLQQADLYPKGVKPPKIYSSASHVKLCCDKNIASICKPKRVKK